MKISIAANKKIVQFQEEFSAFFPFLKTEFFTRPHEESGPTWSKYMIFNRTKTLGEIRQNPVGNNETDFVFLPEMKTGDFEKALWDRYALSVQVFRKSMGSFLETTASDSWTLAEQNSKGEESAHTVVEMVYEERTNED